MLAKTLTKDEAKKMIILAQGLSQGPKKKSNVVRTLKNIQQLSYIQIDTISVIERAHHHTLWSRDNTYTPDQLKKLMEQKKVFEYWTHAAAYLPIEHYRYSLPRKKLFLDGKVQWFKQTSEHLKHRELILKRIKSEGPLQSKDLEKTSKNRGGWFNHSISKQALEKLFMDGFLMVSHRSGFQKVYDLTERVLPSNIDTSMPSSQEMARYLIETSLKYQGLASEKEICYLRNAELKNSVKIELKKMILEGEVIELSVKGLKNKYYALSGQAGPQTKEYLDGELKILSPFDSFMIQRQRVFDFFDFKYQIECYVPKVKRKYGYFTLPILYRNNLVGVIDTVADRTTRKLIVNDTYIFKNLHKDFEFQQKLQLELSSFSKFNDCDTDITLGRFKVY